jgi:hypothetical protein
VNVWCVDKEQLIGSWVFNLRSNLMRYLLEWTCEKLKDLRTDKG